MGHRQGLYLGRSMDRGSGSGRGIVSDLVSVETESNGPRLSITTESQCLKLGLSSRLAKLLLIVKMLEGLKQTFGSIGRVGHDRKSKTTTLHGRSGVLKPATRPRVRVR